MMWDDDPLSHEKYFIFDAIIAFSRNVEGRPFTEITVEQVQKFIDGYFAIHRSKNNGQTDS